MKPIHINRTPKKTFSTSQALVIKGLFFCLLSTCMISPAASSDIDLKDSPLSLSLSTTASITNQQLVITQYGIYNTATVNQAANAANSTDIMQQGMFNQAHIVQDGQGNIVNLAQYGDHNLGTVIQQGDANIANITQLGEQQFTVHQLGNSMVVNITQY
ncbi:curlin subunit CsgB [Flocculibacter collagenilyticus]|uniref:curlin subunit CsgB n=1 Tax=Flocculibacter collagenilyticus TaxID=2744479 RepID=UPI0018F5DD2F|nr:curlin subunit CsgB [Flocculibacter collagenilyticus]